MARLGIHVDAVAALRELQGNENPDPVTSAVFAEIGGADGIVCTLEEGLKPITERDIRLLREIVKTHLNVRVPLTDKLVALALSVGPDMITLISGKKPGSTPGGGLDVMGHLNEVTEMVNTIRNQEIVVSVLIDPIIHQVKAATKAGADYVEFNMRSYAAAEDLNERSDILEGLGSLTLAASKMGLGVAAGSGLNYQNATEIAAIPRMEEINAGHAVVSRALWVGMETAVRDMAALVH